MTAPGRLLVGDRIPYIGEGPDVAIDLTKGPLPPAPDDGPVRVWTWGGRTLCRFWHDEEWEPYGFDAFLRDEPYTCAVTGQTDPASWPGEPTRWRVALNIDDEIYTAEHVGPQRRRCQGWPCAVRPIRRLSWSVASASPHNGRLDERRSPRESLALRGRPLAAPAVVEGRHQYAAARGPTVAPQVRDHHALGRHRWLAPSGRGLRLRTRASPEAQAMTDPIDLSRYRESPDTVWWTGTVGCTECGHSHVAVAPIPRWAAGPRDLACASCGAIACIPVAEGCEPSPWPWEVSAPEADG